MITKSELLMGRDIIYPDEYSKEISQNLDKLLVPMNKVRAEYGRVMFVSSGWRPAAVNDKTANAAKASNHMKGLAVDIKDTDGRLWTWCIANLALLQKLGLYLEDKRWTKTWVHFQCVAPRSGKRIYIPSAAPATDPKIWDGKYDSKYDQAV